MAKNILIYENNPLEPKKFPMEELISLELKEDGATLTYKIAPSKTKRVIIPYSETLVLVPMSRLEYEINKLEGLFWDYPVTEIPYIKDQLRDRDRKVNVLALIGNRIYELAA